MKYILSFLLCCTALAQQTVNNFTVKTNLNVGGATSVASITNTTSAKFTNITVNRFYVKEPNESLTNTYELGNGNWGGPTASIPYFRSAAGSSVIAFDLMPAQSVGDTHMDICNSDITADSGNWEALMVGLYRPSTGYGIIKTKKSGTGTVRPLVMQQDGGNLGIGNFGTGDLPLVSWQQRLAANYNHGFQISGSGIRWLAFNNDQSSRLPIDINFGTQFTITSGTTNGSVYHFGSNGRYGFGTASPVVKFDLRVGSANEAILMDTDSSEPRLTAYSGAGSTNMALRIQSRNIRFQDSSGTLKQYFTSNGEIQASSALMAPRIEVTNNVQIGVVTIITGAGSPEGSVTANAGSIYLRSAGGSGSTFYVKEGGSGNTGWVAK